MVVTTVGGPGASLVVHAIAAGRKAAEAIDRFLLQKK
jgi:NADPH-dependent glutamate synthase beta subunit-like oxidoreductase